MRRWSFIVSAILFSVISSAPCRAQEDARRFISAMEAYKAQDYTTAISNLEAIAQKGTHNGALYYNLGNAHLKNNDLGRAILWYERALELLPNDPDLRFNYDYARSLTRDEAEEEPISLARIIFFWKYQLNSRTIIYLALGFNILFWSLLLARRITRRRGFQYAAAGALIPALIFIVTAAYNYYESSHRYHGIVLAEKVSIRSGLEKTSTELFVLHAGAKVKVVRQLKDHIQIRFSKEKIGWAQKSAVGLI
ncbi:MAG: tetratricopeptide repeat protein [Desulfobacteraceae bacterium]